MYARLGVLSLAALVGACAVGPDFKPPPSPGTDRYAPEAASAPEAPAAGSQPTVGMLTQVGLVPARWWESFQNQALNDLVDRALMHSPTVLEARARLREAEENLTAQTRSTLFPSVDAQLGATREKIDPAAFGIPNIPATPPFTLYNAQVNVFYTLDVFGGNRRAIEGMRAQRDYQSREAQAAELTLAANVVAAVIRRADLQAQVELNEQIFQAQSRQYEIAEQQYRVGGTALEALQSQRSGLEQLRAVLPPLNAQREQVDHQLAVYTGSTPAESNAPAINLADLHWPAAIPLTLPAELVRRRPDVQAYEALWHQASANAGVATANLYPAITLSGYAGSERSELSDLADSLNVWSIGAKLMQPIFHAGALQAQKRSAVAAYDVAAQAYEETVLESLQQVADALRALDADGQALQARSAALEQNISSYAIAQQRFDLGGISEASLLEAKRDELQSTLDHEHAEAQRLADTAALLHAMAGPI